VTFVGQAVQTDSTGPKSDRTGAPFSLDAEA